MSTRSATIVRQRTYTSENDYTYDEQKSALCVESIWSFNANY